MNANEFLHAYVLKHPDEEVDGKDIAGALDQLSNERSDERKLVKLIRADVSETEVSFGENVFYTTLN
ncbi:MAG: hypothetical protein KJ718_02800 [Nanoarchaeota archaeon]|nr:hypothetical protein [Nanoarchaeota archaeon]